ncbi:helix-hairpin-helix domain-containing protein [Pelotomaculum propionicicum]|uniref:helix-hairpin-helix domain-containing protein n=1 Tax=Pelotomaculum propionicicum TaxID=258475 RepID=UPI003B7977E1
MSEQARQAVLKQFRQIPGVGRAVALDLYHLGYRSIGELKNQDPEEMYLRHCCQKGTKVDRCMLYVFRCAVYYASADTHNPDLLKWWNWKDK